MKENLIHVVQGKTKRQQFVFYNLMTCILQMRAARVQGEIMLISINSLVDKSPVSFRWVMREQAYVKVQM